MKRSILVIDDDASLRRVLEFTLQEEGYEVMTAASGEEGLDRFAKERPIVVVTDVRMPGINGYQVLKTIKALYRPWQASPAGRHPAIHHPLRSVTCFPVLSVMEISTLFTPREGELLSILIVTEYSPVFLFTSKP